MLLIKVTNRSMHQTMYVSVENINYIIEVDEDPPYAKLHMIGGHSFEVKETAQNIIERMMSMEAVL